MTHRCTLFPINDKISINLKMSRQSRVFVILKFPFMNSEILKVIIQFVLRSPQNLLMKHVKDATNLKGSKCQ